MKIQRTANAGVLICLDGVRLLLDGVCRPMYPYEGTPDEIKEHLSLQFPDVLMFTHYHDDHYDENFSKLYKTKTLRPVYGSEFALFGKVGNVKLKGIPTRHIGKSDAEHVSYVINGSKCIWFMGDASPLELKNIKEHKPDVLIIPYAYVTTKTAWEITKSIGADKIILLHMPKKENDIHNLWQSLKETVGDLSTLIIPEIGEVIQI